MQRCRQDRLADIAQGRLPEPARLTGVCTVELQGGYISRGVFRHDLLFQEASGGEHRVALVEKLAAAAEVRTMLALAQISDAPGLPTLLAYDPGFAAHDTTWFLTPFYDGPVLNWGEEVPEVVLASLAKLHARFLSRVDMLDWLPRVDAGFFTTLYQNARAAAQAAAERDPALMEAAAQLTQLEWDGLSTLTAALARLPLTLVHGDVHPGNIIRNTTGGGTLIDWGTARLAPAGLDLANVVPLGSAGWASYLAAFAAASGQPVDADRATCGYHWATAMVNLQYLPFAAAHWHDNVPQMVSKVVAAARCLEKT